MVQSKRATRPSGQLRITMLCLAFAHGLGGCESATNSGGLAWAGGDVTSSDGGAVAPSDAIDLRDVAPDMPDATTPDALPGWLLDAGGAAAADADGEDEADIAGLDDADIASGSDGADDAQVEDAPIDGGDGATLDASTASEDVDAVAVAPQCVEGACCDVDAGLFLAAGTSCGTAKSEQWKCSGSKLQSRTVHAGCSGADAACSADAAFDVVGPWSTQKTCSSSEQCVENPPKCKAISPKQLTPCQQGVCWQSKIPLPAVCGSSVKTENFGSGKYNVHRYILNTQAKTTIDLSLATTAGSWKPALVIQDTAGKTLFDGQYGTSTSSIDVQATSAPKTSGPAKVRIKTSSAVQLYVFVTGWAALDSNFKTFLPQTIKYALTISLDCAPPPTAGLTSPPCFDPKNVKGGYYLLPQSCPAGLYTRKADDCSRGTKRLIDVLYTVAARAKKELPAYSPLHFNDLNEGSCSVVDHLTHDDGTHADVHSGCATKVSCTDNGPAIALAKMFIDTGEACGILFNDTGVQAEVNAYFASKFKYKPWGSKFMRSVTGHTTHFHVRVKKPDGSCN